MSKMEAEFLSLTKIKAKPKEDRQKFLSRIYNAAETLFDSDNKDADTNWEEISEEAQKWYTEANEREKGADIEDFPDADESGDGDEDNSDADASDEDDKKKDKKVDAKNKKAAKPEKNTKPEKAAAKPDPKAKKAANGNGAKKEETKPKARASRGDGKCAMILNVIWTNPTKKIEQLHSIAEAKGATCSKSTVSTLRSDFMRAVNFLDKKGALSTNPFSAE